MRHTLSYSNVMATLALFFALTGGAMAVGKFIAVGDPAGGDLTGTYPNPTIAAGKVTTDKLADGSVSTAKLADGSVSTAKLADGTVSTAKLADGSVSTAQIADGSVSTAKLADGSVSTAQIADGSVSAAKLATGVRMWAVMTADGTLTDSSGAIAGPFTGKFIGQTGAYQVEFNTTITHCSAVATPSALGEQTTTNGVVLNPAMALVYRTSATQIGVNISDASGLPLDEGFTLAVFC